MYRMLASVVTTLTLLGSSYAQAWPERTVRVVVPYSAGSTPDGLARTLFMKVAENTEGTFIIDNKPGASAMLGTGIVAKAKPDGYTLVFAASGPMNINTLLFNKMPYDPFNDLEPVGSVASGQLVLVVSESVKAADANELFTEIAAKGPEMAYGSSGIGTGQHLMLASLLGRTNTEMLHVPFGGTPQVISALINDDIQVAALPIEVAASMVRAKRLGAIAATGPTRGAQLPDLPTLKEQGIDFAFEGWMGVAAPGGTPATLVEEIYRQLEESLTDQSVIDAFRNQGFEVRMRNPADFRQYLLEEVRVWEPVIKQHGIALD